MNESQPYLLFDNMRFSNVCSFLWRAHLACVQYLIRDICALGQILHVQEIELRHMMMSRQLQPIYFKLIYTHTNLSMLDMVIEFNQWFTYQQRVCLSKTSINHTPISEKFSFVPCSLAFGEHLPICARLKRSPFYNYCHFICIM